MRSLENTRILVTGGSGFIGRHVVSSLLERGYFVRVFGRKGIKPGNKLESFVGDITNESDILKATDDIDIVIHLAALKVDEANIYDVNVKGAENIVKACKANNINLIINISSSSTKIKNKGDYAKSKSDADKIIKESGINFVSLLPSIVYENTNEAVFGSLAKFAKLPITPIIGNGKCKFFPIHVRDLAKIITLCLEKPGLTNKEFDVGGEDTLSINEIIDRISEDIYEKKAIKIHINAHLGLLIAKALKIISKKPPITESNILGSTQDVQWDKDKIYKLLDFKPVRFTDGLALVRQEYEREEARVMLEYIFKRSTDKFKMKEIHTQKYMKALVENNINTKIDKIFIRMPFLLGPMDAITKIIRKNGNIQKRIQIALALAETDVQSAPWLLPKDRNILQVIFELARLSFFSGIKIFFGLCLILIPNFVKNHDR